VQFSDEGFPMLDRYAVKTVVFEEGFRGPQRQDDFKRANDIFGWARTPRGMVWHHKEDGRTMVLVDRDLHREVAHWGGVRVAKRMNIWEGENR
ncbi:MAG TPA: HNH endonuclease, partial [Actinopolymorphaceae bacterium]